MEHRMRCKVCGKIWCFTDQDLKASQSSSLVSGLAAIGTIASAFGGTAVQQHMNYDVMERNQAKVVDYHQCPNCRSKDVSELSEEEWNEVQIQDRFPNTRVAVSINANATTESLLNRIKFQLEDKDWPSANAYCDAVLDAEPENAMAYVYKLMAELRVSEQADLENQATPFDTKPNYQRALRFADEGLQQTLKSYIVHINERNEQERLKGLYDNACAAMQQSTTEENYKNAAALFAAIKGYKDADSLQTECLKKAEQARLEAERKAAEAERKAAEEKAAAAAQAKKTKKIAMIAAPIIIVAIAAVVLISNSLKQSSAYNAAVALAEAGQYDEAIAAFTELGDYKDSAKLTAQVQEEAEEAARLDAYNAAVALAEAGRYDEAIAAFKELGDYRDSAELISSAELEKKYIEALTLLENRDFKAARATFEALGDYKDAKTYLDGFVIRLTSWTYDGKESGEYQYNKSGDVIKSGNWTYVYSADKRTITRSAKDTIITETYDEQGHLAQRSEESFLSSVTSTFTYEFNSDGTISTRIEKRTEHNGSFTYESDCVVSYEYGDNGLVGKETETETSAYNLREGKGPNSITIRKYYYDDNGQMLSRTDTVTSYNPTTGEARESNHRYEYTSGWVYAPNAEE